MATFKGRKGQGQGKSGLPHLSLGNGGRGLSGDYLTTADQEIPD